MRPPKMHGGQIRVRDPLEPFRVTGEVNEIVAPLAVRKDLENLATLRALAGKPLGTGEAELHESAVMKIDLVLDRSEIKVLPPVDGGLDRIEEGEPMPAFVHVVHQQASSEDIRRREIHLQAR